MIPTPYIVAEAFLLPFLFFCLGAALYLSRETEDWGSPGYAKRLRRAMASEQGSEE
jgi:hypothetical protein